MAFDIVPVLDAIDFIRENLAGVRSLNIPKEELDKILGGNVRKMLKIS